MNITDDASGIGAAVAAISTIIKSVAPSSPYIGAAAGIMWLQRYAIKKISGDGKYGISFKIYGLPPNMIMVPWRQ